MLFWREEGTDRGCPREVEPTEQDHPVGNGVSILVRPEGLTEAVLGDCGAHQRHPGAPKARGALRCPRAAAPRRRPRMAPPSAVNGRGVR